MGSGSFGISTRLHHSSFTTRRVRERRPGYRGDQSEARSSGVLEMTRRQRALASAIAIVPVSAAGILLVRCNCAEAAYIVEVATAVLYFLFIMAAPRN